MAQPIWQAKRQWRITPEQWWPRHEWLPTAECQADEIAEESGSSQDRKKALHRRLGREQNENKSDRQ